MAKEITVYTAKEMAEEIGVTPAILRQHIRALKIEKPEGGWKWTKKADYNDVLKQVKARIKELEANPKPAKGKAKAETEEKAPKGKGKTKPKAEEAEEEDDAAEEAPKAKKGKAKKGKK